MFSQRLMWKYVFNFPMCHSTIEMSDELKIFSSSFPICMWNLSWWFVSSSVGFNLISNARAISFQPHLAVSLISKFPLSCISASFVCNDMLYICMYVYLHAEIPVLCDYYVYKFITIVSSFLSTLRCCLIDIALLLLLFLSFKRKANLGIDI